MYVQTTSTQCDVGPVFIPIWLLATYFNLPQSSVMLIKVFPHGAIVNLLQRDSSQCGVGQVCVPRELLSVSMYTLTRLVGIQN